jgi:electron transfer flavoprotein alpha subunit
MAILVLLDHEDGAIKQPSRSAIAAAAELSKSHALGEIHVLLVGKNIGTAPLFASGLLNVAKVLQIDDPVFEHPVAENLAALLVALVSGEYDNILPGVAYTHVLASSTTVGKSVIPRAAALLDVQSISDVSAILGPDRFVRPIYAGNALATVRSLDRIKFLTIRAASFDPVNRTEKYWSGIPNANFSENPHVTLPPRESLARAAKFVGQEVAHSERPELSAARVVISGGRGMGSRENFALLEPVADTLGAALGASRAAVDAGYAPNDFQVGQTGKVVAPELYIAVGISGAIWPA